MRAWWESMSQRRFGSGGEGIIEIGSNDVVMLQLLFCFGPTECVIRSMPQLLYFMCFYAAGTSLVWDHMAGIFIRVHHRHHHQRNKKQNSLRSQRKFSRSFRFEPSARTYEIGSNHFNRVGSGGRVFMGFLGGRWFVRVSVVTRR